MNPVKKELETIRQKNGGILDPEAVVEFARNPKTAMHSKFDWDDSSAGQKYRLWQARSIINVYVEILPQSTESVRAYVSLPSDRKQGGGYRALVDVLSNEDHRAELLGQALSEARLFQRKYQQLKELSPVFAAIEDVEAAIPQPLKAAG